MSIPSAESARAMTQAVLMAHLCHRYHDLVLWASRPLKDHIHASLHKDGANLKSVLSRWEPSCLPPPLEGAQVEQLMHEQWSPDQLPLAHPSVLGCCAWDTAPVFLQREPHQFHQLQQALQGDQGRHGQGTSLALIPMGRINGTDLWGIVLAAEMDEDEKVTATMAQEQHRQKTWKYDHLTVISEKELAESGHWTRLQQQDNTPHTGRNQSSRMDSSSPHSPPIHHHQPSFHPHQYHHQQQRSLQPLSTLFLPPMQQQQQQQHTLLSHRPPHHDEVEEDPEDDYWGQYGDAEDDSPIEETNKGSFTLSQGFTSTANVDVADSEDEDDDNDYWGKYVEEHEDEEEAPRSSNSCSSTSHQQQAEASNLHFDHDPSSEILNLVDTFDLDLEQTHGRRQSISGSTGSETRRILACIEDTCPPLSLASGSASTYASAFDGPYRSRAMSAPVAMAVPVAIPTSMSIPGQVDPTALSILLERLISHADNEYRVKEEEEEDESTNEFALAGMAGDNKFSMDAYGHGSTDDEQGRQHPQQKQHVQGKTAKVSANGEKFKRDSESSSLGAGSESRSRSQSLSMSSDSSTSTSATLTDEDAASNCLETKVMDCSEWDEHPLNSATTV